MQHHHCRSIARQDYHWIEPEHPTCARDFLPVDLEPGLKAGVIQMTRQMALEYRR